MYSKVKAVIAGLIIGSVGGCATESAPAATGNLSVQQRCESLQSLTAEGVDLAIESAVYVSSVEQLATRERLSAAQQENFAPFCKITGYFEQRTGANGQSYAIGFGLSLHLLSSKNIQKLPKNQKTLSSMFFVFVFVWRFWEHQGS